MKLEEEIKQSKPFQSELEKLVVNIHFTSSWLNAEFMNQLKPFDLTPPQYNVLRILKGRFPEGYCNQDITKRMIDKSSNATRIADKLLRKGLIIRTQQTFDRRLVDIKITQSGLDLLEQVEKERLRGGILLSSMSEENAIKMNQWLDEIRG